MRCSCGATAKVVDVRRTSRKDAVRRRRECRGCGERFTTYELREEDLTCLPEPEQRAMLDDRNEVIAELMEGGCNVHDVAEAFGLTTDSIWRIRREYGDSP